MISRIRPDGFMQRRVLRVLPAAAALFAIVACNVSNGESRAYMNVAKDPSWDAYDSLEITWQDSANGMDGLLFRGKPGDLRSANKFPAEGYRGQPVMLDYRGFLGDSLVSDVRQSFDPAAPILKLDTILAFHPDTLKPEGRPPKVTALDSLTVITLYDSVSFTVVAALDSADPGPLEAYAFDYDGDGKADDSSSLSGRSAAISGVHRFDRPGTYATRLRVHSASGAWTELTGQVLVLQDEPTADAGPDQSVFTGDTVNLNGAAKDSLGHIVSKEWKIGSDDFAESSGPWTFPAPSEPGDIDAVFRATDDDGQTAIDSVVIHVLARTRPALTDLQVSAGKLSPPFNPADTIYADTLPFAVDALTVTPFGNGTLTVKGAAAATGEASAELRLNEAATNIPIVVSLPGAPDKTYSLNVVRLPASGDMTLSALSLPSEKLDQDFSPQKTDYSASVAHADSTLKVAATLADTASTLTVNGAPARSGAETAVDLVVGANTIPIVVTAPNGGKNTYTLNVTRAGDGNSDLAALTVSAGSLSDTLAPDAVFMTLSVPNNVDTARITAKPVRGTSTMAVNKQVLKADTSLAVPLAVGDNILSLLVTAQSGDKKTYTVLVTRAKNEDADLAALALTAGDIVPAFAPGLITYSLSVGNGIAATRVTARAAAKTSSLQVNGTALASGDTTASIPLKTGDNPIIVQVTAESKAVRIYTVTVNRALNGNADLADLTLSAGKPDFSPDSLAYNLIVPNNVTTITATPTLAASGASTVKVNGMGLAPGAPSPPIPLALGLNAFPIQVTAENGAIKVFKVEVFREFPRQVCGSSGFSHFIKGDGTLWGTGSNGFGQLGDGTDVDRSAPVQIMKGSTFLQVSSGLHFTLMLRSDNTLWATGENPYGQFGNGTLNNTLTPVQINVGAPVIQIAAGWVHSLFLKSDGTLWSAGFNTYGELGNGKTGNSSAPVQIMNGSFFTRIAAGAYHSLMIKSDGTLWATGHNDKGQLGTGNAKDDSIPVQIMPKSRFARIAAGGNHSLMIDADGYLWATGYNADGELGDGSTVGKTAPVRIMAASTFTQISSYNRHSLFIKSDGTLWATGNNAEGELGDGTTVDKSAPVQIMGGAAILQVSAGYSHTLIVKGDGTFWATGINNHGALGDGSLADKSAPVQVLR